MIETKLKRTLYILKSFHDRPDNTLDSYDENLQEEFGLSRKQIERLLDEVADELDTIVPIKVGRKKAYKLIKPVDLFVEAFSKSEELGALFHMAHDADPEVFEELSQYTNQNPHTFQFMNTPFEDTKTLESKETFKKLKSAVDRREYRKITFNGSKKPQDNLKCLKLIFMENNWYLAYVGTENKVRFARINFIEKVEYASNVGAFQPSTVKKQMEFLKNIQNSMSLYDREKKIAKLKVEPSKAKYFDEGMKLFMSSQKFVSKEEDGSIIFTLEYTQPMEVLPFVQSWLPSISILEPAELREIYVKKLKESINLNN